MQVNVFLLANGPPLWLTPLWLAAVPPVALMGDIAVASMDFADSSESVPFMMSERLLQV